MRVTQHHCKVRVTQQLAHGVQINSGLDEATCEVMSQIVKAEIRHTNSRNQSTPGSGDRRQSVAGDPRKYVTGTLDFAGLRPPSIQDLDRFDIEGYPTRLSALCGRTLDVHPLGVGIDVLPLEVEQFAAA